MLQKLRLKSYEFGHSQKSPNLKKLPTHIDAFYKNDDHYEELLKAARDEMGEMQERLYAQDEQALLVILQGMDTSGKDGAIKHVFSGVNPQGCRVVSFKKPTSLELDHDYLWRTHLQVPPRGMIGIFNRSYYEDVLVPQVHTSALKSAKIPKELRQEPRIWKERYQDIVNHEAYLTRQGIRIVKFYLHISKAEQRERLLARIENPAKHWKFDIGDFHERNFWDKYQEAYNACLRATSASKAPWYVIPSDDKKNARLIVSEILVKTIRSMRLENPRVNATQERELRRIQKALQAEKG